MKTAELRMIPVTELKPAEYNPRKKLKPGDKEYEKIKNSIEEFGFADPLVVNADMTIIGGHQRMVVAMSLGYTEVPCAVVDVLGLLMICSPSEKTMIMRGGMRSLDRQTLMRSD